MALKRDRETLATNIEFYLNEVAEPGVIACYDTSGSGVALDHADNQLTIAAAASGAKPAGLLLTETVDVDETVYVLPRYRDITNIGNKVCLLQKGWVVTDKVNGTVAAGDTAILDASGFIKSGTAGAGVQAVGTFKSAKDEDGFAKVYIDL